MAGNKRQFKRESEEEDKVERDLQCFLNQPNINMIIPWVYSIYRSVKDGGGGSGGGGGGGGGSDDGYYWDDLT